MLTFGVAASFFAVVVAPLNVIGRIVYVMGKEGVVPRALRPHPRAPPHAAPRAARSRPGRRRRSTSILLIAGADPMEHRRLGRHLRHLRLHGRLRARRDRCVIWLRKQGIQNGLVLRSALIAVVAMAYVFFANVLPVPAFPLNVIPYLFLVVLAAAIAWYLVLRPVAPR